ncbi:MAG: hypothetical protein AAF975_02630 [Spirochaetota bacterium]
MPANSPICILPSEALDLDALASSLLFAELWQSLPFAASPAKLPDDSQTNAISDSAKLQELYRHYQAHPLHCLLPLKEPQELLWRKDIAYLLQFLGQRYRTGDELETLNHLFVRASQKAPDFTCAFTGEAEGWVLLDRHHLPLDWPQDLTVLAIWDHRPDSGALRHTRLRRIQAASSCTSLLLDCAIQLGLFSRLSEAALILAMATLHLDQKGRLLDWEQPIWQSLDGALRRQISPLEPEELHAKVLQERHNPLGISLFEQVNTDVKIAPFTSGSLPIHVAVAVVPAGLCALQELCEDGTLAAFTGACLERLEADFLILLHRRSAQNEKRSLSFLFCSDRFVWNLRKINFFLLRLEALYPGQTIYYGKTKGPPAVIPALVQWEQTDQSMSRKNFMPAFRHSFTELLNFES